MFSDRLKYWRNQSGLSQKALADKLFVSQQALAKWEVGSSTPNPETIQRIAGELKIPVDAFFDVPTDDNTDNESEQDEIRALLQEAKDRPEIRALFSVTKNATKEDIEQAIKIIKALREDFTE